MRISPLILLVDAAGAFVGHRPQKRSRPKSSPSRTIPTTTSLLAPSRPAYQSTSSLSSAGASSVLSREEIARYSRHLVLSDVGVAGQAALKNASVLVIGAGGLGSPCLLYLAAAGVGHVGIVDADVVDESNLQRQIIHGTSTVNVSKCASAQQRMLDINPHVQVRTYEQEFTSETAISILGQGFSADKPYDIVVDGSDNFPTKYLINDACALVGVPWVYSAILAFEGQLSVFNYQGGPDYRDLLPTPPPPGDVPSCAEGGVLGVLPGTMGCLQATETIKLILKQAIENDQNEICSGRVMVFDAMKMNFHQIGLQRSSERSPIEELIDYQGFCGGPTVTPPPQPNGRTMDEDGDASIVAKTDTSKSFHTISPQSALEKLKSGWAPWVLDVRLPTENDIVALPFTDRVVPHRSVQERHVPAEGDVLVYCKAGVRGKKACVKLIEEGVDAERLYNLEGGILKWQSEVDPSMPRY